MRREELHMGDIVVVENNWFGRPTVHYIVMEVNGSKYLCSFYGDVNCSDRPAGWYPINEDELPGGTILVTRPIHQYNVFSRLYDDEDSFQIIYKREDADEYL